MSSASLWKSELSYVRDLHNQGLHKRMLMLCRETQNSLKYVVTALGIKLISDFAMKYYSPEKPEEKTRYYSLMAVSYLSLAIALAFIAKSWAASAEISKCGYAVLL